MKYSVYAVVYDTTGRFLLATKNDYGYFFHCSTSDDGVIYPQGVLLTNGGGDYALPGGGQLPDEGANCGGRREFWEETGVRIPGLAVFSQQTWQHNAQRSYIGCYYEVGEDALDHISGRVNNGLAEGRAAQHDVSDGTITEYLGIYDSYPDAPADNELDHCDVWNILDDTDWGKVKAWNGDPAKGWYFVILRALRVYLGGSAT